MPAPARAGAARRSRPRSRAPAAPPRRPRRGAISERVREAARAAGEAARAAVGDVPAPAFAGEPARPAALAGPREGGPDDLKKIKGVGPKLEELLHSLGFYHFDQIAAWSAGGDRLGGRASRRVQRAGDARRLGRAGEDPGRRAARPSSRSGWTAARCTDARDSGRMLADKDRIFTNLYGMFDRSLAGARARGQWDGTAELIGRGRDKIVEEVKASGLRGRGGAGFPTGLKWSFMPKQSDGRPHYLVVNADESEPGTCKDREIMRHDPHTLVEGCLIAGFAMGAHAGYIYIRGEYIREREALQVAIDEAYDAGLIGQERLRDGVRLRPLPAPRGRGLYLRRGDGAAREPGGAQGDAAAEAAFSREYRALRGADHGQQRRSSIAVVPTILRRGHGWFASFGRPNNAGTKVYAVSGHVNAPCVVEDAMSITLQRPDRQALRRGAGRLEEPEGGDSGRGFGSASAGKRLR